MKLIVRNEKRCRRNSDPNTSSAQCPFTSTSVGTKVVGFSYCCDLISHLDHQLNKTILQAAIGGYTFVMYSVLLVLYFIYVKFKLVETKKKTTEQILEEIRGRKKQKAAKSDSPSYNAWPEDWLYGMLRTIFWHGLIGITVHCLCVIICCSSCCLLLENDYNCVFWCVCGVFDEF